jgi:hypothetical protein
MLDPTSLIDQAERLLDGTPTEADVRRAVSAAYYALFNLLTSAAADPRAVLNNPELVSRVRRTMEHRGLRKVCEAFQAASSTPPKGFDGMVALPISPKLIAIAKTFSRLQDDRYQADYDLNTPPNYADAKRDIRLVRQAFQDWSEIGMEPNTQVFLTALLVSDRWTRRG